MAQEDPSCLRSRKARPSRWIRYDMLKRLQAFGEYGLVNFEVGGAVEYEPDQSYVLQATCLFPYGLERHPCGLLDGVAEDAGRDGGECDGLYCVLFGEREGVPVAVGEKLSLGAVSTVDGSQGVYDVSVREPVGAGYHGLTGLYGAERPGFLGEIRPRSAVDGSRDPAAWPELRVRRVDHGVHVVLGSYVSLDALDCNVVEGSSHVPSLE